jgi:hypothetical protein
MNRNSRTRKAKVGKAKEVTWTRDKAIFSPREREVRVPRAGQSAATSSSQTLGEQDQVEFGGRAYMAEDPAPEAIEAMLAAADRQTGGKVNF